MCGKTDKIDELYTFWQFYTFIGFVDTCKKKTDLTWK